MFPLKQVLLLFVNLFLELVVLVNEYLGVIQGILFDGLG